MGGKRKSIVFVNQSAGYLMVDIVNYLSVNYENSVLLAGEVAFRETELNSDVKLIKICKYNRKNNLARFLTWALASFQAWFLITFKYRNAELFLVSNPPLNILIPFWRKAPYSFLIYDVYPDVFISSKLLSDRSIVYKSWQSINRNIFKSAKNIFTISDGLANVISNYVPKEKIKVVPIWTNNSFLKPVDKKSNSLIKELNLEDKFIVMYSGNFGKTHPIEVLVEIARLCKIPDIHFLFVGSGDKFDIIHKKLKENSLTNCSIYSLFSIELLPLSLAMPDIGVVLLDDSASDLSIPSKTFSLLSTATPILGITKSNSSLANLIDKYRIGYHFSSDELEGILHCIVDLYQDRSKLSYLRNNSLRASEDFTVNNVKKICL